MNARLGPSHKLAKLSQPHGHILFCEVSRSPRRSSPISALLLHRSNACSGRPVQSVYPNIQIFIAYYESCLWSGVLKGHRACFSVTVHSGNTVVAPRIRGSARKRFELSVQPSIRRQRSSQERLSIELGLLQLSGKLCSIASSTVAKVGYARVSSSYSNSSEI